MLGIVILDPSRIPITLGCLCGVKRVMRLLYDSKRGHYAEITREILV